VARRTLTDVAVSLSLANVCLTSIWSYLFSVGTWQSYWLKVSGLDFASVAANVVLLAALFFGAARLARASGRRGARVAAQVGFLLVLLVPANFVRQAVLSTPPVIAGVAIPQSVVLAAIALPLAALLLAGKLSRVAGVAYAFVLIVSPLVVMNLGRAAWIVARYDPTETLADAAPAPPLAAASSAAPRVVLLIFDELDANLVYSERPKGLTLPHFDRLRSGSVFSGNAFPPGTGTLVSIPGIIHGVPVSAAQPFGPAELRLTVDGRADELRFGAGRNLFADARGLGYNAALVGWYHPYCRIFGAAVTRCRWQSGIWYPRSDSPTLPELMRNQLAMLLPWGEREGFVRLHRWMEEEAAEAAADPSLGFVYLHLSMPHPPGIYDRESGRLTPFSLSSNGYLDNLVLADVVLGRIRAEMERAGIWDRTTFIVSSDHPLRSAEAVFGHGDPRIPFLVKVAGGSQSAEYAESVNTALLPDLIREVLRGRVRSADAVVRVLDSLRVARPDAALHRRAAR
jgi:hypothetical protein